MAMMTMLHRKKKQTKKMAGIAVGSAAAGAVGALMLTPKTGKEMRGKVAKGAKAAGKKAAQMTQKSQQAPKETIDKTQEGTETGRASTTSNQPSGATSDPSEGAASNMAV